MKKFHLLVALIVTVIMHHFMRSTLIQLIHYFVYYSCEKDVNISLVLKQKLHSTLSVQSRISVQMDWLWPHVGGWIYPTFTTVDGRNFLSNSMKWMPQTKQQVNPPSSQRNPDSSIKVSQEFYRLLRMTSLMLCLNCMHKAFKLTHELFSRRHDAWVRTFGTRSCLQRKGFSIIF